MTVCVTASFKNFFTVEPHTYDSNNERYADASHISKASRWKTLFNTHLLLPLKSRLALLWRKTRSVITTFSPREKLLFFFALTIFAISAILLLSEINRALTVEVPARGGSLVEGVLGTPRFINPLLAISDADRDLTSIIYSGLLRATPDGILIPDLAHSYTVSPDGLTYTFTLKEKIKWHDGEPITADDIVFTIMKVKDGALRSPKRASWEGVSVRKIDDKTVEFTLLQPYSPFLENTTLGILPEHLWKNVSTEQFSFSELNVTPVASGPYRIRSVKKNSSGIPEYYDLVPFRHFTLGRPYIAALRIKFYPNSEKLVEALESAAIESASALSPERLETVTKRNRTTLTYTLPRVFGAFFNQNQNAIFTDKAVREALYTAIPRDILVEKILGGYGIEIFGALPPGSLGYVEERREETDEETLRARAEEILEKAGWKKNPETGVRVKTVAKKKQELRFSIATSEAEELKRAAELIKQSWEKIGALVEVKIFKTGDLNQEVIRPRKYDALFFGEIIGRESDPFAFWHSSQRNDPGLNIALYANITTDKLLERGRVTLDTEERANIYRQFESEIRDDVPFVPMYSPTFIYIVPKKIRGIETGTITIPSERFLDIHKWHIETTRVWKFFAEK